MSATRRFEFQPRISLIGFGVLEAVGLKRMRVVDRSFSTSSTAHQIAECWITLAMLDRLPGTTFYP